MPRGFASMAEYYRAHREEMELALATGCTPAEARAELRRQAKARRAACGTHARNAEHHDSNEPGSMPADQSGFVDWQAPWMLRD